MEATTIDTKETSISAEEYLWGVIYYADWIKPGYKKLADAYRTDSKALRELYLCFCDKVPESALKEAAKNERIDVAFKLCRKEHLEKQWMGEYSEKLKELSTISSDIENEVKQMSDTVSIIAETMPDWDTMFSKEIPDVLPAQTVTTAITSKPSKQVQEKKSPVAEELSTPPSEVMIKNEVAEKKAMERVSPQKKGKVNFFKLFKKKIGEILYQRENPSLFVIELYKQGYSDAQINFILDCLEQGMTAKEIDTIADPKIPVDMMEKLRDMHMKKKGDIKNGK